MSTDKRVGLVLPEGGEMEEAEGYGMVSQVRARARAKSNGQLLI